MNFKGFNYKNNNLFCEHISLEEIGYEFGTPIYVYSGTSIEHAYNEHRSGFYLILHLRHHFDPKHSYTSLTLARDTYGLYTSSK